MARMLAQAVVDLRKEGTEVATPKVFSQFVEAVLPYMVKERQNKDQQMQEMVKRETEKGILVFNAPSANPFVQRAKTMAMPDEVLEKLSKKKSKRG
jgi:hypothetical protein